MKEYTEFDAKEYFQEECAPILEQLLKKCGSKNIPCYFTAAVKNDAFETEYVSNGIMTKSRNIVLADDRIKHHMLVSDGCVARPPAEKMEIPSDMLLFGDFTEDE